MNNILPLKAASPLMSTLLSMPVALRWLRRSVTILLVFANLALTLWATVAR